MRRRSFLKTTIVAVGGSCVAGCGDGGAPDPFEGLLVEVDEDAFPQSVASGDPRESSVILWTRVSLEDREGKIPLRLQVALDEEFRQLVDQSELVEIEAAPAHDHCVRVRLTGLDPDTTYYYRFGVLENDRVRGSRTGRTRTAPARDADVEVRFAVASCQDYVGRYYHSYAHMAEQDLAFFVHLGDYIYETLGDPRFQMSDSERSASFDDEEGALEVSEDGVTFFAARSLDNYRQLYKLVRSDPNLRRVHERFPMVAVWDDHEFSDDAHGQTATYFSGRRDETDPKRRANADQAWFEYMPVDYEEPDFEYDRDAADFPADLTIYRDLVFGKHLHLVMTDLRRYRSDHLVPEDAFPGAVAITEEALEQALGELPEWAEAYVDLDADAYADHKQYLNAHAEELGFEDGVFSGLMGIAFINRQLAELSGDEKPQPLDASGAPLGMTYERTFKTDHYSRVGSRYVLRTDALVALSKARWEQEDGACEQAFGAEQERWLFDTLQSSDRTWKVWGNEFTFMTRNVDLRDQAAAAIIGLQDVLTLSAEDWDGMPSRRERVLEAVGDVDNLVAVTGDIHAFFAGVERPASDSALGIIEFVAGGISSASYGELLRQVAESISPVAVPLADNAQDLLEQSNTHLAHVRLSRLGYGLCTVRADELEMTFYSLPAEQVLEPDVGDLQDAFSRDTFLVTAGKKRLERRVDGEQQVWDDAEGGWS